jgi:hypothetical protein
MRDWQANSIGNALHKRDAPPTSPFMPCSKKLTDNPAVQWTLVCIGWFLIILAPLIGWLPGPGGLILFPIGLALVLKYSPWAKRRYSRLAKRHPEYGEWANWAMRRKRFKVRPPFPPVKRDLLRLIGRSG